MITAAVRLAGDRRALVAAARARVRHPDRLDDICLAGLGLTDRLLAAAGLDSARLAPTPHALLLGSALGCVETDYAYYSQVLERGPELASRRMFAYTLPNSVLGEIAIAFSLTGENLALCCGRASGVTAVVEAAEGISGGVWEIAIVLCIDAVGPGTRGLFEALGTTPQPVACGLLVERETQADRRGIQPLATICATDSGFDPDRELGYPALDPLGGAGLAPLEPLLSGHRIERPLELDAACSTGHWARARLEPTPRSADRPGGRSQSRRPEGRS